MCIRDSFGADNFRNLITRRKCSSKNFTSKQYANINDFILFYTKGRNYTWNQPGVEAEDDWVLKEYPKTDDIGRRYKLVPIHAPGTRNGETGQPWRDMVPPPGKHWQYAPSKLEELDRVLDERNKALQEREKALLDNPPNPELKQRSKALDAIVGLLQREQYDRLSPDHQKQVRLAKMRNDERGYNM